MQRKPSFAAVSLLISLLLFPGFAPFLLAQDAPPPSPQQLDQLLAPIALYPDSLLAQITTASTNPQEVLDVNNWLASNPNLTGTALTDAAQQQGFDPAFIALANFPTVLQMMAENIDDYAAIGQAVTTNQAEVTASIQRLRAQAYASGALRSNQQLQVQVQQGPQPIYVIQPASPQVVYIPQYDPTVVYAAPSTGAIVATSLISFGVGIGIGALIASNHPWGWGGWGWNWGGRSVYYNHGPWGGWHGGYRPPNYWYRPRPVLYGNRPGYGGNWHYRPPNYRPPRPVNRPVYNRPGYRPPERPVTGRPVPDRPGTPGNRPGTPVNRPDNRPAPSPGRPGTNPPGNTPGNRPGNGSGNSRPVNRPGNGNNPSIQPVKPGTPNSGTPNNRPSNRPPNGGASPAKPSVTRPVNSPNTNKPAPSPRPAPQTRPAPQSRPAPQAKPAQQHNTSRPAGNHSGGNPPQTRQTNSNNSKPKPN